MQLLFTPCDILDVAWTRKQNSDQDSMWVSQSGRSGLMSTARWQCLLACRRLNLCVNKQQIFGRFPRKTDATCYGVLLKLCSRPSILLISSTIWSSFWLISAPLCQKATKERTKEKTARLLHPSQVHGLRTSGGDARGPTRHKQWFNM